MRNFNKKQKKCDRRKVRIVRRQFELMHWVHRMAEKTLISFHDFKEVLTDKDYFPASGARASAWLGMYCTYFNICKPIKTSEVNEILVSKKLEEEAKRQGMSLLTMTNKKRSQFFRKLKNAA